MKIAVFLEQELHVGGVFQQALNLIILMNRKQADGMQFVFFTTHKTNVNILSRYGVDIKFLKFGRFTKLMLRIRSDSLLFSRMAKALGSRNKFDARLEEYGVDLIYFISPNGLAIRTDKYNYIVTAWDMGSLQQMEFPELRENRGFEISEYTFRRVYPRAVAVLVDSQPGKEAIIKRFHLEEDRVKVMPFSPSADIVNSANDQGGFIDIKRKYDIDGEYIFYPAQFWAHKNHVYILEALEILKEKHGHKLYAIFSGGDKGNLSYIKETAERLQIRDLLRFAGFVDGGEMSFLYKQSLALVMPTYLGPTNIPPYEAFLIGTPVIYSDLPGLRDQVGDAALLADLSDPGTLAGHLSDLQQQPELRQLLIKKGKDRMALFSDEDRWQTLSTIFEKYRIKRACWGK